MTNIKIDDSWKIELEDEFNSSYMSDLRIFLKEQLSRGKIIFPLEDISLGKHRIQIKVSDNYNNISTKEVVFIIDDNFKEVIISKIPSARLGEPDDVANAVLFLSSDKSNYINGETLHVNGGMYMS